MFKKFFGTFRQLHINLPLLVVLQGMPTYTKYFRDVVDNKVKMQEIERVALIEEYNAVIIQNMPKKLKD